MPLAVIGGHNKAVSYVRFMGGSHVVSASTDDTLKLWDVARATGGGSTRPDATFRGAALLKALAAAPQAPVPCLSHPRIEVDFAVQECQALTL